ncbi:MAG TPA: protease inhibitor I42 family protein [Ilumatobacteraceae bacterium]|jgi:inhibitor of cysteine peptidase|nr:protease inhibitor I42 family protein [Ilumatobacteraceae bacterium]
MKRWVALVAAATLLAACGDDGGTTVELDVTDSLSDVSLDVGDQLDVSLEANPTTGYSWELGPLPEGLELVSSEFEEPGGSLVGAPGMQRFAFEAVGPGSGILRFEYVRVFDDPVIAEQIVEYVLTIED